MLGASLAVCGALSCKPGRPGSQGASAPNVFQLADGEYSFVRGTQKQGDEPGVPVFARGGTGKLLSVESKPGTGGKFKLVNVGKYGWRSEGQSQEQAVDCTTEQDIYLFDVYSVVEGTGRLGNVESTRGCRFEPEAPQTPQWKPVSLTPKQGNEFVLLWESVVDGKKLTLEESYRLVPPASN